MRTVYVSFTASGAVILNPPGTTRETSLAVYGVPDDVTTIAVIKQIEKIVLWPWVPTVAWAQIDGAPQGRIIRPDSTVETGED